MNEQALSVFKTFVQIGLNLVLIGIAFAILSVSYALGTFTAGWLSDKFGTRPLIVIGLFVDGTAVILVGLNEELLIPSQWTIFTALALIGSGAALADVPTYSDLLQQAQELYSEEDKESVIGAVSGITAFSQSFGSFLGAILGGFLTFFTDVPTASLVLGEIIIAHGILVLGVSVIDHIATHVAKLQSF